ncbi:TrbC/VirB2 family protein [Sphingomonas fuzhouensis]|uniref:TrbC/VirB2 family protein n=1 Tax=Sphingomonas fuzhouensis TaxID=3106033 RepID=UPI0035C907CF
MEILLSALLWIERLTAGSFATAIATIAVAMAGLAVMAGRLRARRGLEIVLGIGMIFGAPSIERGVLAVPSSQPVEISLAPAATPITVRQPSIAMYDPYAGASVPKSQTSSDIFLPVR